MNIAAILVLVVLMLNSVHAQSANNPMRFSLHASCEGSSCEEYILAQGTITSTTPLQFAAFIATIKFQPTVYFDSPGGDLGAGIRLGLAIRKRGLDTYIGGDYISFESMDKPLRKLVTQAVCYSACAYAFLGGVDRMLKEPGLFGVHQFQGQHRDSGEASAQVTVTVLGRYVDSMGVDRKLLDIASVIEAGKIQLISRKQAQVLGVDNQNPPLAHWRLQANSSGELMVVTTQKQAGLNGVTTLAFLRKNDEYELVLFYKTNQSFRSSLEMQSIFANRTQFNLEVEGQKFRLKAVRDWSYVDDSAMTYLSLPSIAIPVLVRSNSFSVVADWANAIRDVNPTTTFGTMGLKNSLLALNRK